MEKHKELLERLRKETYWSGSSGPGSREIHPLICDEAADAIAELMARAEAAERQRDEAMADLEATRAALAEAHGLVGVTPKTMFGVPLGRLYELAEADKDRRCVIFPDLKGLFGLDVLSDILNRKDFESCEKKINREAWKHLLGRFERKV